MKKKYWVGSIITVLIVIYLLFMFLILESWKNPYDAEYSYPIKDEWKNCKEDIDCHLVETKCCSGCGYYNLSLNEYGMETIESWKSWNCVNSVCPLYQCEAPILIFEAFCFNGICSAKKVVNYRFYCDNHCLLLECSISEINKTEAEKILQDLLDEANVTLDEAGSNCNCVEICEKYVR